MIVMPRVVISDLISKEIVNGIKERGIGELENSTTKIAKNIETQKKHEILGNIKEEKTSDNLEGKAVGKKSNSKKKSLLLSKKQCNGYQELCDRQYDKVAYACTHNSFASNKNNIGQNQNADIETQLNDGIRAFMLDFHSNGSKDFGKLISGGFDVKPTISKIAGLLGNKQPQPPKPNDKRENFSKFSVEQMANKFVITGLTKYIFNPNRYTNGTEPDLINRGIWPTLNKMIEDNNRLVVLADRKTDTKSVPWILDQNAYESETSYEVPKDGKFECTFSPSRRTPLKTLNHFVYKELNPNLGKIEIPSKETAPSISSFNSIFDHAKMCSSILSANPSDKQMLNFIAVDFYDEGKDINNLNDRPGVIDAVARINGVPTKDLRKYKTSKDKLVMVISGNNRHAITIGFILTISVFITVSNI
ncbi:hypothetical protein AYI70_g4997 [Smittium culicis]|uniref:PI-PLC X domain-containing protein n=1 Tax=Smittium culicis TaxID=133412 RepID=A0A1R1XWP1_9FUNG|nr:hypothetical protein AYI70_g4997 [Smittium culicis]